MRCQVSKMLGSRGFANIPGKTCPRRPGVIYITDVQLSIKCYASYGHGDGERHDDG
jgi:hypothetical protein